MAMRLNSVVPFGRSLNEYRRMFLLTEADLQSRILGVGDGPASVNAELTKLGGNVVSVDPLYQFDAAEIQARVDEVLPGIIEQVKATPDDWVWSYHRSPEDLRVNRIQAAMTFANDYAHNRGSARYVEGRLPHLDFVDRQFDLALCSHLLFLYSDQLDAAFHLSSILEMLRVADQVRIFPLLTLMRKPSPHLPHVMEELRAMGYAVDQSRVEYELQKGGNEMLVIKRQASTLAQDNASRCH